MSREAFGDPPESQDPPQVCPVCGNDWHAEDCEFGKEVARRLKAERDAHRMQFALHRLWPALERAMSGMVFTADRAGEVQEDMNTLREYSKTQEFECLGEPGLCTNPRGCDCQAPSEPHPSCKTPDGCRENGCLGWCDEHLPEPTLKPDIAALKKRLAEDPGFAAQVTGEKAEMQPELALFFRDLRNYLLHVIDMSKGEHYLDVVSLNAQALIRRMELLAAASNRTTDWYMAVVWPLLPVPGEFDGMDECDQSRWRSVVRLAIEYTLAGERGVPF